MHCQHMTTLPQPFVIWSMIPRREIVPFFITPVRFVAKPTIPGHGGRLPDDNGDEEDGYDETLIPVDYQTAGQIRDDLLYSDLVGRMPEGSTLTCLLWTRTPRPTWDVSRPWPLAFWCKKSLAAERQPNWSCPSLPLRAC